MITKSIPGISGKVTNSIASTDIIPEPALHLTGTYSPVFNNSKQQIKGKLYNPIHRITENTGEEHLVESIYPIDIQRVKHAANGTITNKNGTIYAFRRLDPQELIAVKDSFNL